MPAGQLVDLVFERSRLLSGSYGGQPVRLEMNVPASAGTAGGIFAGAQVSVSWTIASNDSVYPDVPAELSGAFAGRPVDLRAVFHLEPGYFFDRATITGQVAGRPLRATAERASGGLGSTSTVAVDGTLDGTDYTIYGAVDGSLTTGQIRGAVAGAPVRLDLARTRPPDADSTRLTGRYAGPPELLALIAGAFLHFL